MILNFYIEMVYIKLLNRTREKLTICVIYFSYFIFYFSYTNSIQTQEKTRKIVCLG